MMAGWPLQPQQLLRLWGPLRSDLSEGFSLRVFCFVCLGFSFVFSIYCLRIPSMCLGLPGAESTFIFGSFHLTFPAVVRGRLARSLKPLFTDEETNTQRIMIF